MKKRRGHPRPEKASGCFLVITTRGGRCRGMPHRSIEGPPAPRSILLEGRDLPQAPVNHHFLLGALGPAEQPFELEPMSCDAFCVTHRAVALKIAKHVKAATTTCSRSSANQSESLIVMPSEPSAEEKESRAEKEEVERGHRLLHSSRASTAKKIAATEKQKADARCIEISRPLTRSPV